MPSTLIETRCHRSAEEEDRLIEAVHAALVEAFRIPPSDRCVRLVAHEPHRFACPSDRTHPELWTLVTISAFTGRSLEAKRALYAAIVRRLCEAGIAPDHVKIILHEIPRENWGLRGVPGSEIELGFKVEV